METPKTTAKTSSGTPLEPAGTTAAPSSQEPPVCNSVDREVLIGLFGRDPGDQKS